MTSTAAAASQPAPGNRTVVGISGNARFDLPGWPGRVLSAVYLGAYRRLVGLALRGARQVLRRFHRGFYTIARAWQQQRPDQRLVERGLLPAALRTVVR